VLLALAVPFLRGGYTFGIEFTGGSEFRVSGVQSTDQSPAIGAVASVVPDIAPRVSAVGSDSIRVQTDQLADKDSTAVREALAQAYSVPLGEVTESFIGPSWGADITQQALRGLLFFLIAVGLFMALYFRTWKMSAAAMIALAHDLIITAGVYGIVGFEVTPAAVIGFLTILGYSLYDTVVVFDKIRENTTGGEANTGRSFPQAVNLAINQTLVRSINTSIVAILPVGAILFIGALLLGAGTLRDIALALFIGILVGTYSTIFLAAPLYSLMREGEPAIKKQTKRALELQAKGAAV